MAERMSVSTDYTKQRTKCEHNEINIKVNTRTKTLHAGYQKYSIQWTVCLHGVTISFSWATLRDTPHIKTLARPSLRRMDNLYKRLHPLSLPPSRPTNNKLSHAICYTHRTACSQWGFTVPGHVAPGLWGAPPRSPPPSRTRKSRNTGQRSAFQPSEASFSIRSSLPNVVGRPIKSPTKVRDKKWDQLSSPNGVDPVTSRWADVRDYDVTHAWPQSNPLITPNNRFKFKFTSTDNIMQCTQNNQFKSLSTLSWSIAPWSEAFKHVLVVFDQQRYIFRQVQVQLQQMLATGHSLGFHGCKYKTSDECHTS